MSSGDEAPQPRPVLWVVAAVSVVAALLLLLLATGKPASERATDGRILGRVAPLIEGPTIDNGWYDIDQLRGQWVVVNFFSTTCVPCIREHPELVKFDQRHAPTGDASVVSISFDDSADAVIEFFADNGGDWPVLTENTGSVAVNYGVTAVPESYLVAPSGIVAAKLVGGVTADDLDGQMARLTQEASS